jgi:hypothetical protein
MQVCILYSQNSSVAASQVFNSHVCGQRLPYWTVLGSGSYYCMTMSWGWRLVPEFSDKNLVTIRSFISVKWTDGEQTFPSWSLAVVLQQVSQANKIQSKHWILTSHKKTVCPSWWKNSISHIKHTDPKTEPESDL